MSGHNDVPPTAGRSPGHDHGVSLFTLWGIEIRLDYSVLIIFALIVFSLATGVFPGWHPDWSPGLNWGLALLSGVAFFASLLAHEMSHSLVSQYYGIPVPRITLFLFGGMAEISREPDRPKEECLIAIAGPAMSFLIAIVCTNLALWTVADETLRATLRSGDLSAVTNLGPVATALFWLGTINFVLAVFNMVPGFPMDGGRVFRALIWAITGDQNKATRWASNGGRFFGWFLMALGVVSLFSGGGLGGLWWILIGWFISSLATMSYRQLVTDTALKDFRIADLMRTRFETVPAGLSVADFVDDYLLRSSQRVWPVVEGDRTRGVVSLSSISAIPAAERTTKTLGEMSRPLDPSHDLAPDIPARDALKRLMKAGDEALPVVEDGRVVGLIQHADVLRWLSLHET